MAIEDADDRATFFDTDDFAVTAIYNGSTAVNGIFDEAYFEAPAGIGGIQASQPVFLCRTDDMPSAVHGQPLVIGAATYKIVGVEPNGTDITVLRLQRQ